MSLFDANLLKGRRSVTIDGIDFNIISANDKDFFNEVYYKEDHSKLTWENTFVYLYSASSVSSEKKKMFLWKNIRGYLYVFTYNPIVHRLEVHTLPVKIEDELSNFNKSHIEELVDIMNTINNKSKSFVGGTTKEYLEGNFDLSCPTFKYFYDGSYDDFVYDVDEIIELKGKKFENRRNMIRRFHRDYPNAVFRKYDPIKDKSCIYKLRDKWISHKSATGTKSIWDKSIMKFLFENIDFLGIYVYVMEIDGSIEGFTISGKFCDNCSILVSLNTNFEIKGLAEAIWYETLKATRSLGKYTNIGSGGKPTHGLYKYKKSFNPIVMIEKPSLLLNKDGNYICNIDKGV